MKLQPITAKDIGTECRIQPFGYSEPMESPPIVRTITDVRSRDFSVKEDDRMRQLVNWKKIA